MNKYKKGFTLIELLVVIAIIGILSSVVLSSLNTAREKGKNAAAKSELASIRSQANLYYDDNNQSFGIDGTSCNEAVELNLFNASEANNVTTLVTAAEEQVGVVGSTAQCANSSAAYVVAVPLVGGGTWCVDSTGYSGATDLDMTGSPSALQSAIACQ
jgi:prepilin-type N-terminal cleavage/methylation domain-containing protein